MIISEKDYVRQPNKSKKVIKNNKKGEKMADIIINKKGSVSLSKIDK